MSFTELQSNRSTLSRGELERSSALDCIKPRASTRLLNLSLWGPKSLVSSERGGTYLVASPARAGVTQDPTVSGCGAARPWVGEVAVNSQGGTFQTPPRAGRVAKLKLLVLGYLQPREMSQPAELAVSPSTAQPELLPHAS